MKVETTSVPTVAGSGLHPTSVPEVPARAAASEIGKKVALGAGIGVLGAAGATGATAWGVHKIMNRMADAVAKPIVNGIESLKALNPFSWLLKKIVGEGGDSHGHGHGGHGHGHDDHGHAHGHH